MIMTELTEEQKQSIIKSLNEIDSYLHSVNRDDLNEAGKTIYDKVAGFLDKFFKTE